MQLPLSSSPFFLSFHFFPLLSSLTSLRSFILRSLHGCSFFVVVLTVYSFPPFADTLHRSTINYLGRCTGSLLQARPARNAPSTSAGTIPVDRKSRPRNLVFRPLDICPGLSSPSSSSLVHDTERVPGPRGTRCWSNTDARCVYVEVSFTKRKTIRLMPLRCGFTDCFSLLAKKFHFAESWLVDVRILIFNIIERGSVIKRTARICASMSILRWYLVRYFIGAEVSTGTLLNLLKVMVDRPPLSVPSITSFDRCDGRRSVSNRCYRGTFFSISLVHKTISLSARKVCRSRIFNSR